MTLSGRAGIFKVIALCLFQQGAICFAEAPPPVLVDAVYWQGWGPGNPHQENLQEPVWHDRHPFYAERIEDRFKIEVDVQEKMDREILAAKDCFRSFAFTWDYRAADPSANYALEFYRRSPYKDQINFYLIIDSGFGDGYNARDYDLFADRLIDWMVVPSYQQVVYGYPLLHIRAGSGMTPDQLENDRLAYMHILKRCLERGISPPYIVIQGESPEQAELYLTQVAGDAVSSYAALFDPNGTKDFVEMPYAELTRINRLFWDDALARERRFIPPVSAGWDARPREAGGPYYLHPSPEQFRDHLLDAMLFTKENWLELRSVLVHAWNETDQGSWLHPTIQDGDAALRLIRETIDPAALFTHPRNQMDLSGSVNLTVRTLGIVMRVKYYADGNLIGESGSAPFSISWDTTRISNGPHYLTVEAYGQSGAATLSEPTGVTVMNGLRVRRDLSYGPDRRHKLDLIEPLAPSATKRPAILLVHGGGWIGGDKSGVLAEAVNLVSGLNMACIAVNYRLFYETTNRSPTQLDDVQRAMRWVRSQSDALHIDPDHIGVGGPSAGGHLAALLMTRETRDNSDSALRNFSSKAQAGVPLMGIYDLMADMPSFDPFVETYIGFSRQERPDLWRDASAITFIDERTGPVLLFHGTEDPDIPIDQARRFHQALLRAGRSSELIELPLGHELFFLEDQILRRARSFFVQHLANAAPTVSLAHALPETVLTSIPIVISGATRDDVAVAYRRLAINGRVVWEQNNPASEEWSYTWTPDAPGNFVIEIMARDRANAIAARTVNVRVVAPPADSPPDKGPPPGNDPPPSERKTSVFEARPNPLMAKNGGRMQITTAFPHSVVDIYNLSGKRIASLKTDEQGSAYWTPDAASGVFVAVDRDGNKLNLALIK